MSTRRTLQHAPKTEDEVLGILPEGKHETFIRQIEVKTNRKGGENFVATCDVYDSQGKPKTVTQWLYSDKLVKHLYDACGKSDAYQNSELDAGDCEGCVVLANIKTEESEKYGRSSKIDDFFPLEDKKFVKPEDSKFVDDDMPF